MPAAQDEVLDYAAKLINYPDLPKVVFEEADMTPMAKVFMQTTNALRMILLKENLNYSKISRLQVWPECINWQTRLGRFIALMLILN